MDFLSYPEGFQDLEVPPSRSPCPAYPNLIISVGEKNNNGVISGDQGSNSSSVP